MSGLLRFSKPTRDSRAEATHDQLDFNFAAEIKIRASAPRTRDPVRRKSVSGDNREALDSDPRTSSSVKPDDRPSTQSSLRLSVLSPQVFTFEMGLGDEPGSVYDPGDGECCHIGMAIGSPTERQRPMIGSRMAPPAPDAYPADPPIPQFILPPVPVEVKGGFKKSPERNQRSGGQEGVPSKGGWKKLFGRSFFGKKGASSKQNQFPESRPRPYTSAGPAPPQPTLNVPLSPAPCLDVDIPGVEMERYSVMFGTLLHPGDRSSLLSRRNSRDIQGLLGEQDQREDETPQPYISRLKRNATTGQVCRSPVSMLGDSGSYFARSPPCSPGLSRSKTTTGASSPRAIYVVNPHDASMRRSCSLTRHPSSRISRISEESSIDTPRESFDEDDEWLTKADDAEPQWEMLTQQRRSNTTPMSEEDIEYAAQVSIARQISVSQRQLLLPIVPKSQRLVSRAPSRKPPPPPTLDSMSKN